MILLSACLAGKNCKYNGGNNEISSLRKLYEEGKAVLVCPEQAGGLPTPRIPSERKGEKVVAQDGRDVTEEYKSGAEKSLKICRDHGCTIAVLKAKSPSCGNHGIYDGTFTHTLIEGKGVFAELLESEGIECINEIQYEKGEWKL